LSTESRESAAQLILAEACIHLDVPFLWQGSGTMLISKPGVEDVIRLVLARGHRILGVEGFEVGSIELHPRLDQIFDSERSDGLDPIEVLARWDSEIWVDITLDVTD
jgi:hypothetical protein